MGFEKSGGGGLMSGSSAQLWQCIQRFALWLEQMLGVPTISAYTKRNCLATTDASKSRSTPILTVRSSSSVSSKRLN